MGGFQLGATVAAYAAAVVAGISIGWTRTARRRLLKAQARLDQLYVDMFTAKKDADRAIEFERWASWTMVSVTDHDGLIMATTVRQLWESKDWDRIWEAPIAVAVFHTDPVTLDAYRKEVDEGG